MTVHSVASHTPAPVVHTPVARAAPAATHEATKAPAPQAGERGSKVNLKD